MSIEKKRILMVGLGGPAGVAAVERLECKGWGCEVVEGLRDAEKALETGGFRIILASEELEDGGGYDLLDSAMKQAVSLFVAVALSESCLWLPAVERGVKTLGKCALHPRMLEMEMEGLVSESRWRAIPETAGARHGRARSKQAGRPHHLERRGGETGFALGHG
jgi:hypothetical protein